jgi:CDP-glycerol glycerophosphotransferase
MIQSRTIVLVYYICRLFPLQDKVIASSFIGRKYGDNPQFILEKLIEMNSNLDLVWVKDNTYDYALPKSVRAISYHNQIRKAYEYATAKVWIDTHKLESYVRKRKGQLFIETWHGGLGIKKIDADVEKFRKNKRIMKNTHNTAQMADIFISNSDHLTNVYRSAFEYQGKVWKCGYPKNDIMFSSPDAARDKVRKYYRLTSDKKLLIYAPTFRDFFWQRGFRMQPYDIDYERIRSAFVNKFGGEWYILVKFHPSFINQIDFVGNRDKGIINATKYPDMQEFILACDAFISDYSSCIFDAALRGVPCFVYANDFEEYKEERGVYYELDELPFPYAEDSEELSENIYGFDYDEYLKRWERFKVRTGLCETGHAASDIAYVINEYIMGNLRPLEGLNEVNCN